MVNEPNNENIVEGETGQLPEGNFVEDSQGEQLSRFVAAKLLEVSSNNKPEMFSREDVLGNIAGWEKTKLLRLHQLQKACTRLKLTEASAYFQREEKKILGLSRSVGGFQQKIIRTTLSGNGNMQEKPDEKLLGFLPKWGWRK